jgi:hypothetical protein
MDGLSDRAFRTFVNSLAYGAEHGTDGHLPRRALRVLHPEGVDEATAAELVTADKWSPQPDGCYEVADWERTQSLSKQVEWQHERNRRKVRAYRERQRTDDGVTGYVTGYYGGEARRGEARPSLEQNHAGTSGGFEAGGYVRACEACQHNYAFDEPPCPEHAVSVNGRQATQSGEAG